MLLTRPETYEKEVSPCLVGCSSAEANRFLLNTKLRREAILGGIALLPLDDWEIRAMMTFCLSGSRQVFSPIAEFAIRWTDKKKAAKLEGLKGKAKTAFHDLSASLYLLSRGWR